MTRIKNSYRRNVFGDGYQKILYLDNDEKLIIKNSYRRNVFGDGYQQEIIKDKNIYNTSYDLKRKSTIKTIFVYIIAGIPGIIGIIITIFSIFIMPIIAIMGWY